MESGSVNLFTSRRINFLECKYWLVDQKNATIDKNELTYEVRPSGEFYAKIENSIENSSQVVAQAFLFDSNSLTISTMDDIPNLKRNSLVKINSFDGIWRVETISKIMIRKNFQFGNELFYKTVIQLRK